MAFFPVRSGHILLSLNRCRSQLVPCNPIFFCRLSNSCIVGENMELWRSDSPLAYHSPQGTGKPLVLMLGWLLARTKHLTKYSNIYASKGFDVLQIRVKPSQVLWPMKAQAYIEKIFNVLEQEDCRNKPILIHGFSVGGYLYGEMLVKMDMEPDRYANLRHRIMGQVFDSPVDKNQVAYGMAQNLVKHHLLQLLMYPLLEQYLNIFRSSVSDHFMRAQNAFLQNAMSLPSLVLFSHIDPIANPQVIERTIRQWSSRGITVLHKSWADTKHVSHLQKYPEEYIEMLWSFLECLPLVPVGADINVNDIKDEVIAKSCLQERSSSSLP